MGAKRHLRVYRLQNGEVAAGIVDDTGALLDVKYLGKFTEDQYASLRRVIDKHAATYGIGHIHSGPGYNGGCETS